MNVDFSLGSTMSIKEPITQKEGSTCLPKVWIFLAQGFGMHYQVVSVWFNISLASLVISSI